MNSLDLTRDGLVRALKPAPSINIVPTVIDFGQQYEPRLAALGRAADKIVGAVHGGMRFAQMMNAEDFAVLKDFVEHTNSEFVLASITTRDDAADQQHSADGYGVRDRSKL